MKVLLNLTNDTLEYQDTKVFIQGTDARNQIIVYADEDITFTNLTIAYQLQNGRTTIAMANSGLVDSESDDYIDGYTGYIFNVPLSVTTLTGNIMATVVANISGAKHKFNVLNTVIDSVFFEAYETALEEAEAEFASDIQAMQSAITQLQGSKADKTTLNAEIARATAKEGELETAIGNETTARIADVDAEELRATAKENEIAGDLATETQRATLAEGLLSERIQTTRNEMEFGFRIVDGRLSTIEDRWGYIEMETLRDLTSAELQEALKPNCILKVNSGVSVGSVYYYKIRYPRDNIITFVILRNPHHEVTNYYKICLYGGYFFFNSDGTRAGASNAATYELIKVYDESYIDLINNDLQSQIDGLNAGQNLADIVADLTALNNLSITNLHDGDKVQVLVDSNHDNASTVYSLSISGSSHSWTYIGKYGQDGYTKSEANALLETKQDLIDSTHKLSSDLVDDTNQVHKFVSASDITNWNNKFDKSQIGYLVLDGSSGTLTDGQYADCLKPYCIIKIGNALFYKRNDDPSLTFYRIPMLASTSDTKVKIFSNDSVQVYSSKNWSRSSFDYDIYTKSGIDTMLSLTSAEKQDIIDDISEVFE